MTNNPPTTPANTPLLRIGTWNLSGWTPARLDVVMRALHVQMLAVQEAHLSVARLEPAFMCIAKGGPWIMVILPL